MHRIGKMIKKIKKNRRREIIQPRGRSEKNMPKTYRIWKANIECEQKLWVRVGVCVLNVSVLDSLSIIPFTLRQFDFAYPMAYISICMLCAVCCAVCTSLCDIKIFVFFSAFLLFGCCFYFSWGFYISIHNAYIYMTLCVKPTARKSKSTQKHEKKRERKKHTKILPYIFIFDTHLMLLRVHLYMPYGICWYSYAS